MEGVAIIKPSAAELYVDSSACPLTKTGFGAFLLTDNHFEKISESDIRIKKFDNTSSTRLELETLLWALEELGQTAAKTDIFTDSQNIITLAARRSRLEDYDYHTRSGKPVVNHELYKKFFLLSDKLEFKVLKLKGHKPRAARSGREHLFSLVDKASRKALRESKLFLLS